MLRWLPGVANVSALGSGYVEREDPDAFRQALEWNPMGGMGEPGEVTRAIAFLASPAASFVSGTNLLVDGALTNGVQM